MVFTAQQLTAFFEAADQMAIPAATRAHLQTEGISSADDLSEFKDEDLKQISENLRRPGRIPDPAPNAPPGAMIQQPPFVLGAKSLTRLTAAANLVRYYETVARPLTPANMRWEPVVKNFMSHWKALTERKKEDNPDTPKITRSLPIINWTEAFFDFLHRVIGTRTIPLAYVVRPEAEVPVAVPALANGQPYGDEHGSVEAELIARASHNHPLFREDNASVYYLLEEATRSTGYAASIKPFQREKNGRAAWLAIVGQYAGEDKWRALIKTSEDMIHNRRWKGSTTFSLEKFIGQHRAAFVSLSQCAEHVPYQLPNELSRVTYLLDNIECLDPPLQAAMALVRNDNGPTGKMNDFEATAAFILPHDPVAKKRTQAATSGKRVANAEISEATVSKDHTPATGAKVRVGPKTGVEFRFHTKAEYMALSKDQKAELKEYRDAREQSGQTRNLTTSKRGGKSNNQSNKGNKKMKTMIAEAVAAAVTAKSEAEASAEQTDERKLRDYIVSVIHSTTKDNTKAQVSYAHGTKEASTAGAAEPPPETITQPNAHVASAIVASLVGPETDPTLGNRTDLDSHANMFVGGRGVTILGQTGKTANVQAFSPELPPIEIPIVDLAIAYDCPYTDKKFTLVARNALYVPSMHHNLAPPFLLREAGLIVNETPKIQVPEPDETNHSIFFPTCGLRIPLSLWGVFSYFPSRKPTVHELENEETTVLLITPPGNWNPNSDAYARNEENMLDWEGRVIAKPYRQQILISDLEDDDAMIASLHVADDLDSAIDHNFEPQFAFGLDADTIPCVNQDDLPLCSVNPTLVSSCFATALALRAHLGAFIGSVGATCPFPNDALMNDALPKHHLTDVLHLDTYMLSSAEATSSHGVRPEHLSKVWRIDLDTAKRTIDTTSQRCVRPEPGHLSRNFSTNDRMLRYRRVHQHFFMDTFFATSKAGVSSRGNKCVQLFVTDKGFIYVVPMTKRSDVPKAIKAFAKEIGAPDAIICDAAREQISQDVKSFLHQIGTQLRILEENTPWANRAERYIGIIKEATRKDMLESDCPLAFWDYCVERRAAIHNLTAHGLFQLEGRNPYFSVTGQEGDISNLCQYKFYEWIYYREQKNDYPLPKELLGRVLGPSKGEGNEMCQWVLNHHGNVVPRRSLRPLTNDELTRESEIKKRQIFDELVKKRWGTSLSPPPITKDNEFEPYEDDDEEPLNIPEFDDPIDAKGQAIDQQPLYDRLINAELLLPKDGEYKPAKVVGRTTTSDGRAVGTYNDAHMLNTMTYEVRFNDGEVKEYAANVIAENLLNQIDDEGFTILKIDCIVDHRTDSDAVTKANMYTTNRQGVKRIRKTTIGWQLLVRWHDGSEHWVPLSILKECNPVEVAEYAQARGIESEPAFAWWVPYTLRKRDVIVAAVTARPRKVTHKYGIEIPRSVSHAHEIDKANGNDYWARALKKEMSNVGVAFEILDEGQQAPVGWTKVTGHLIFDVKMSLERKARWVLDGHLTETPDEISTYAGVVSRESIRIALTYAALNGLDVWASDIRNAYIQAPSSRKDYIICGPEFGLENVGRVALIRRAVYGGKTAGRDYRNHLRECMDHLGFKSCRADPDVWMREAVKNDGSEYWEYVLLYCDDTLAISERGEHVIRNEIGRYFELKEESIGPPDIYLGGKLRKVQLENGVYAWAFGSSQYVQAAVQNVEKHLRERHLQLPAKALTPLPTGYRPETDVSNALEPKDAAHYQSLIGVLRWIVELGRVDICCEVSMMSSHLALPREGHLLRVYHIFAYLKKHHNAELVFDPTDPVIDMSLFERKDWTTSEMSQCLKEVLPENIPRARGLGFIIRAFVDADHATDSMTRKSRTGFLVYVNGAPIYWLSKKQTSVETSSFGSEFTAMKACTEYIRGLRYKLRMMGIPCDEPAYIYGDNKSVLYNTSIPESTLKKKSQSLAYHFVREGAARDEWRTAYVNTHANPADLLTKPLPSGEKRHGFVRMILHHLFPTATVD